LIANILNKNDNEDYSKLKQIVKEIIKAILSENKQVISVSSAALLQTLKSDAEMVKLIYNMCTANTGGYKDNSNNIANYLESNKGAVVDLAEKNYNNLVERLTNDIVSTVGASPSNPTVSLPQSSSILPNLSTQNDTYRIEDSQIYDNGKGDVAD
jgi:hypothetical protein